MNFRQPLSSAHGYALPTVSRWRSRSFGYAALRMFRANQEAKSVSIMRTRSAQIGVQPATIDAQLDGQIGSKRKGWKVMRGMARIKAVHELWRYLQRIPALAALTWGQKVIQTSDGKIKGKQ